MASGSKTGTITANATSVTIDTEGMGSVTVELSGTWVGTVSFYVEGLNGTTNPIDVAKADAEGTFVNSSTANGIWRASVSGYKRFSATTTAYTSGTIQVALLASEPDSASGSAGGGAGSADSSAANQTLQINLASPAARSDTYTTTATGTAVDGSLRNFKFFGIRVTGTGAAPTSWTVVLEVSVDGTTYNTLLTHTNTTDSNGAAQWSASPAPGLKFRSRCTALSLGSATNIVVDIIGAP